MLVNVGCGDMPRVSPWLHIDSFAGVGPDLVAEASCLPLEAGAVDAVYCGHLLEHLDRDGQVQSALTEFRRVLRPGGRLCVVGPDFDRAAANPEWQPLSDSIAFGGDRWPGDRHLWVATGPETLRLVAEVFPDAAEVDVAGTVEWPVWDRVGWQCAVLATKET